MQILQLIHKAHQFTSIVCTSSIKKARYRVSQWKMMISHLFIRKSYMSNIFAQIHTIYAGFTHDDIRSLKMAWQNIWTFADDPRNCAKNVFTLSRMSSRPDSELKTVYEAIDMSLLTTTIVKLYFVLSSLFCKNCIWKLLKWTWSLVNFHFIFIF